VLSVILKCVPDLSNVVALVLFFVFIFGIVGVQLFSGDLRGMCYSITTGQVRENERPCGFIQCAAGYECMLLARNPGRGVYTFDNIGSSILTTFVVMTYEGAYDIIADVQEASTPNAIFFFLVAFVAGPIFAFNLFLVVISNTYNNIMIEKKLQEAHSELTHSELLEETGAHVVEQPVHWNVSGLSFGSDKVPQLEQRKLEADVDETGNQRSKCKRMSFLDVATAAQAAKKISKHVATRKLIRAKLEQKQLEADVAELKSKKRDVRSDKEPEVEQRKLDADKVPHVQGAKLVRENALQWKNTRSFRQNQGQVAPEHSDGHSHHHVSAFTKFHRRMMDVAVGEPLQDFVLWVIALNTLFMMSDSNVNLCLTTQSDLYSAFRFDSDVLFDRAEEKKNSPVNRALADYKAVLEGSNMTFTMIFVCELLFKLFALGPKRFFITGKTRNWNIFDFVVVSISVAEFQLVYAKVSCLAKAETCLTAESCPESGIFDFLRILRLVRLGKLFNKFPDAFKQIKAILSALSAVGSLLMLVLLVWFCFTILGMNLFGGFLTIDSGPEPFRRRLDAGELMRGADVYVDLPVDPWAGKRPASMPGRRGVIIDVDADTHADTPWKVEVWGSEGLRKDLALVPCKDSTGSGEDEAGAGVNSCVWASDDPDGLLDLNGSRSGHAVVTGIVPRHNFDTLFYAVTTTFQVITMENWNDILADMVPNPGMGSAVYLIAIIVVGNMVLTFGLMLAIIMNKFAQQRTKAIDAALKAMKAHFVAHYAILDRETLSAECLAMFNIADADGSGVIEKRELQMLFINQVKLDLPEREFTRLFRKYDTDGSGQIDFDEYLMMFIDLIQDSKQQVEQQFDVNSVQERRASVVQERRASVVATREGTAEEKSFYLFGPMNPLRAGCTVIVSNLWFDRFILLCIFFSAMTLALDAPLIPVNHLTNTFLNICNYILNAIFIMEALLKMIAQTFAIYISSSWSRLDLLIVCTSILDMILSNVLTGAGAAPLKTLRVLRALRPVRLISRAEGLKVLISAIYSSAMPILATCCIALCAYALMGLVGMQLLLGKMATCSDNKVKFMRDCWGLNEDGEERVWLRNPANFDHLPSATITVFRICTLDNWPGIMWSATDASGRVTQEPGSKYATVPGYPGEHTEVMSNYQLEELNRQYGLVSVYFLFCIVTGTYIVMNMFVSVFVDAYMNASYEMRTQKRQPKLKIVPIYDDPTGWLRSKIHSTWSSTAFEGLISLLIVSNIILMAFESYKQASWQTGMANVTNIWFTIVFGWECVFKLYTCGGERYYASGWNRFDFFIVMISYGGIIIDNLGESVVVNPTLYRILRIFRIFRILRAFRALKSLKGLLHIVLSLVKSLPGLMNLFLFFWLVLFIFGALSTALFGTVCVEGEASLSGMGAVRCALAGDIKVGRHWNFRHIGEALGTLFRIGVTGDAWADVLEVLGRAPANLMAPIPMREWQELVNELGYDPRHIPQHDARFNAKLLNDTQNSTVRMEIAKVAIRRWNNSAFGMDDDADWPTPASVPAAGTWLAIARKALPGCLTDDMVSELEMEGLMDCSQVSQEVPQYPVAYPTVYDPPFPSKGNSCQGTCAIGDELSFVIASIFLVSFIIISSFVVLQLVIAVLMDQMSAAEDAADGLITVPGSEELHQNVFNRMYSRFHLNARRHLRLRTLKLATSSCEFETP
jgi:Ca2+-binding EF-hand superfamily protein